MVLSAFDVIGPIMVGPSSSHTAGAARLGLAARALLGSAPTRARIALHGSFAATGLGHATDRALIAGLLGLAPDDPALPLARERAADAGLAFSFTAEDLGQAAHPNTVRIELEGAEAGAAGVVVVGSSLGGGIVEITEIDGYATSFRGDAHTLVCWHEDRPGFLAKLTALLACAEINIATLRTTRHGRGRQALSVVEVDAGPPVDVLSVLRRIQVLTTLRVFPPLP